MNRKRGMTTSITIAIIAGIFVLAGVVVFNMMPKEEKMMIEAEALMQEGEEMMKDGEDMMDEAEDMMESI